MTTSDASENRPGIEQERTVESAATSDKRLLDAEIEAKKAEIEVNNAELKLKQRELKRSPWLSPLVLAILAATIAAIGNALVTILAADFQISLEDRKAEQGRILEMLKTGDPDKAAENLEFLLQTGLIADTAISEKLRIYLENRNPGEGASLASSQPRSEQGSTVDRFWRNPNIAVCWENPSPEDKMYMRLVESTISKTWAASSSVKFVGWERCSDEFDGVRIRIADEAPHTKGLGQFIRGRMDGVVLNFRFNEWSPSCATRINKCIVATAVHQFGHVLGFAHEHNRQDVSADCGIRTPGGGPVFSVGPYDPNSVMNYCNPNWLNGGELSDGDVAKVRTIYGSPEGTAR